MMSELVTAGNPGSIGVSTGNGSSWWCLILGDYSRFGQDCRYGYLNMSLLNQTPNVVDRLKEDFHYSLHNLK